MLVVQLVLAMALRPDRSITAVLEELVEIVGAPANWRGVLPKPSSITAARDRLGWEPLRHAFFEHASGLDGGARWLQDLRVAALDATTFRTPDSPENEAAFGRPGGRKPAGYPMIRCLCLVDVFDHTVLAATFGPYKGPGSGELSLAKNHLLDRLPQNTVILMDRGFCSYDWLRTLAAREIPFVVRLKTGKNTVKPITREVLSGRNDRLVEFPVPNSYSPKAGAEPISLRRIKWTVPKQRMKRKSKRKRRAKKQTLPLAQRNTPKTRHVELLTNLVDHEAFPWWETAQLYLRRWEVEFAFREIKSTLTNRKVEFRSKRPRRVLQEAYALLLAYNMLRQRMAEAAHRRKLVPTDLSFTDCLHAIRRAYVRGSPVSPMLTQLSGYVLPKRDRRWYPRAVKARSKSYPTKQVASAA
jgi:hypothetical protein